MDHEKTDVFQAAMSKLLCLEVTRGMTNTLTSDKLSRQIAGPKKPPDSWVSKLGVIAVDADRRIAGMNPAAGDLLRIEVGAFVHRPLSELMARVCARSSDVKRTLEAVRRALDAGHVSTFELQLPGGETPATYLRMHASPMRGQDAVGPSAVLTLEDITAYKQVGLNGRAHENARRYAELLELITRLEQQKEQYRLQSIHDGLTGVYNYAHFQVLLADEVARARRYEHPLALLMIDIDDFKAYNDSHGHPAGSWALRDVATILQQSCRQTDRLARYGGEEFAVILPETNVHDALVVAERLRRAVERESQLGVGFRRPITVSVGAAAYPRDADNPQKLILRADERLYQAKAAGKNCVCRLEETPAAI